jgi:hypothetical protein
VDEPDRYGGVALFDLFVDELELVILTICPDVGAHGGEQRSAKRAQVFALHFVDLRLY